MRADKLHRIVWFGLLASVILSCNVLENIATPIPPTGVQPSVTSSATAASTTATVNSTTQTPVPPTAIQGPVIAHLSEGQAIDVGYIHMVDTNQGWGIGGLAQARDHVFRTQTGGLTWRDITPPEPAPAAGTAIDALGFFADSSHGWVVYYPADPASFPSAVRVWFTADGGASWMYGVIDTSGVPAEFFTPLYLYFSGSQNGWLLVGVGAGMNHAYVVLYSTRDGGKTWTDILDPSTGLNIQSFSKTGMVFVNAQTGWLTRDAQGVDSTPHIFNTQDGGISWTRIDLPPPAGTNGWFDNNSCGTYSPVAFSAQSVFVSMMCLDNATFKVEQDFLYSTSDGGQTWQSFPLPSGFKVADPPAGGLFFTDMQNGLALGRWIYRTDNGGKTWSTVKQVNWDGQFSFVDINTGWAVASNAGQLALVRTVDGGGTWKEIQPVVAP